MVFRWLVALLAPLIIADRVAAQDLFVESSPNLTRPVYPADGLMPTSKHREIVDQARWRSDIIFGLPTALRAQRQIGDHPIWAEGGAALYVILPSVFVGLRYEGKIYEGEHNSWYSRPGLDIYYSPVRGGGGFLVNRFSGILALTLDNDISWQRKWSNRVQGQFGLKAGVGVAVAGGVWPVPILGLTCGLQY